MQTFGPAVPSPVAPSLAAKMPFAVYVHQKCDGQTYQMQSASFYFAKIQADAAFAFECANQAQAACETTVCQLEIRNGANVFNRRRSFGPKHTRNYSTLT